LASTNYVIAATNGLVTKTITNGLVSATITNGLATTSYVTASTNGLATTASVIAATNPIPSWITASTSGLVRATITNGLASTNYVINYVAGAISGIPVYATGNNIYVDNRRTDPFTPDGTIMRPYATVSAAMAVIGSSQPADWENVNLRYYAVKVMPGTYVEDVTVPWRPFISVDLSSAVIVGNVTRSIPDGDFSTRVSTLVVKGDSLRPAYLDGIHTVIGIAGKVIFEAAASSAGMSPFHELQVIDAGISGGVEYKGTQNANSGQSGHVFLRDSQVGTIQSTEGWSGVSLFSYGWGGGHQGGGPAGSGVGSLIGRVLPYNLQSTMISGGMNLQDCFPGTSPEMLWHNVRFETNFIYNVTNVSYGVKLDNASYNSWLEASLPEERGVWTTDPGGKMSLTDFGGGAFGNATNMFRGFGTTGAVTSVASETNKYLRGDGTWVSVSGLTNATAASIGAVPTNRTITIDGTTKALDANLTFTTAAGGVTLEQVTNVASVVVTQYVGSAFATRTTLYNTTGSVAVSNSASFSIPLLYSPAELADCRFYLGSTNGAPTSIRAAIRIMQKPEEKCTSLVYLYTNQLYYSVLTTVAGATNSFTNVVADASGFIINDMYAKPLTSPQTWQTVSNYNATTVFWNCSNMVSEATGTLISHVNRFQLPSYIDRTGGTNLYVNIQWTTPYTNTISYSIDYYRK